MVVYIKHNNITVGTRPRLTICLAVMLGES